jgi:flagella basal body P-ring formation protein FlgA
MIAFHRATFVSLFCAFAATVSAKPLSISAQVEQAARQQLEKQADGAGLAEPRFELSVVTSRAAPACAGALAIEPLDTRNPARMRFVARCPDGGGAKVEYIVRARVSALVAVTAAPVAANQPLTDDQVTLERREVTNVSDPIGMPEDAVGQTSRRSLRAGEVLRASQLAAPLLVKRGDPVVMVARMDGIEVSTAGEALDAGARGALVRVRNAASGQVVRMRVVAPGTVEPVEMARISR